VTTVRWLNEEGESGLPFDLEVVGNRGIGGVERVRRCEVKTRSVLATGLLDGGSGLEELRLGVGGVQCQWPISAKEVVQAMADGQDYFCLLLVLAVDYSAGRARLLRATYVGYEGGLRAALQGDGAALLIQTNTS